MRKILICTILIFVLVSCRKREYVHVNDFCTYKNYITPDTIPFDISRLTQPVDSSILRPNKVLHLNAYNFIHNKNIKIYKIQDSLYRFLHKKYLEFFTEQKINTYGLYDFDREYMSKIPKHGCYYYCGSLALTPKVRSLVFLTTGYEKSFSYDNNLILINVKDNKISSIIKLSGYNREDKEEDVEFKTFLIDNKYFIAIESPYENYQNIGLRELTNKKGITSFEDLKGNKELSPFDYYSFYILPDGYVRLIPTIFKLNNLDIINKEGQIPHRRGIM
jgi:hypothetical protein